MIMRQLFTFALIAGLGAAAQADEATAALRRHLANLIPGQQPDAIVASPLAGVYQVSYGPQVFYISADGRYVLEGSLIDLKERRNLTSEAQADGRKAVLERIGEEQMVVFAPEQVKHTITVFTDVDCPYCRKLHGEIDQYLARGIKVRYMLYPRAGVGSPSYDTSVSIWCAEDRKAALTAAKSGKRIPAKTCDNPVRHHLEVGHAVGVQGTPAIVLEDGTMVPGYRPAAELAQVLDQHAAAAEALSRAR